MINVPLAKYGSLDWRRSEDLGREGYDAAEAMRDQLLPLAVSEESTNNGVRTGVTAAAASCRSRPSCAWRASTRQTRAV